MRRYETIFIIRPNVNEEDIGAIIDRASGIIQNSDGSVLTVDKWGLRKLAYLIKKESQGFYVYMEYAGLPEAVDEIERVSRIDDKVLKYMTVKLQDVYVPGPMREVKPAEEETDEQEDSAENETTNEAEETASEE